MTMACSYNNNMHNMQDKITEIFFNENGMIK